MAVYTELSFTEIGHFLESYDLPKLKTAEGIRAGIDNTNYLLLLEDGRKLILTLFEKRVTAENAPFFAGLMEHIASRGFPAPLPLKGKDGNAVRHLKDKTVMMVTFLEGKGATDITEAHIAALGGYAAKLHLATQGYASARENSLSLEGWKKLFRKIAARADEISPGLADEMQGALLLFERLWPQDLPQGIIHADLFPDNVFYDDAVKLTGVIDFYFACNDAFAYELAVCINAWCFDGEKEFNPAKAAALLKSYNAVRPLSEQELDALPVLAYGAALRFLLTRTHDWIFRQENALVTLKDPLEYLHKLRFFKECREFEI